MDPYGYFFCFARGATYIAEQTVRDCSMHAAENIMYRTPSVLQFTCEVPELQRRANWTNRVEQKDGRTARKLAWLVKCPLNKTRLRLGWPRHVQIIACAHIWSLAERKEGSSSMSPGPAQKLGGHFLFRATTLVWFGTETELSTWSWRRRKSWGSVLWSEGLETRRDYLQEWGRWRGIRQRELY